MPCLPLFPLGILLAVVPLCSASAYTACASGRYGPACTSLCLCAAHEACSDGPHGDGSCTQPGGGEASVGWGHLRFEVPAGLRVDAAGVDEGLRTRQVHNATISRVQPTPLRGGLRIVGVTRDVAHRVLGLPRGLGGTASFIDIFSGRKLPPALLPGSGGASGTYAHAYGGHQFGHWAGQLGDGRAISLGTTTRRQQWGQGHGQGQGQGQRQRQQRRRRRGERWEISLKGAGRTPYSRGGDGRAVLQSVVREFFGSAALHALGVPTVRALAIIGGNGRSNGVSRDEWYTGSVQSRAPGVLVRVAPSMLRFGSFQLAAKRQGPGGLVALSRYVLGVLDGMEESLAVGGDDGEAGEAAKESAVGGDIYTSGVFKTHPTRRVPRRVLRDCFFTRRGEEDGSTEHAEAETENVEAMEDMEGGNRCSADDVAGGGKGSGARALSCLLERVVLRTAALVAAWRAAGFAHGVMNTDNMSILGKRKSEE